MMDDIAPALDMVLLAVDSDAHQRRHLAAEMDALESAENAECEPADGDFESVSMEEVEAELAALEENVTLPSTSDEE